MTRLRFLLAMLAIAHALSASRAVACGVSGPDGVSACSLAEHEEATRPRWRAGVSGVYTSTALRFGGGLRGEETRGALLASVAYVPTPRISLQAAVGTTLGGDLTMPAGRYVFLPGVAAALGASWRVVDAHPFVVLSSVLSFSAATTKHEGLDESRTGYEAFDLRGGAVVGTTFFDVLSPYATARVFGGPVFWRYQGSAVTGTDVSHFQIGGGFAFLVARRVDVFAEGIPLGERAVSAGVSVAF